MKKYVLEIGEKEYRAEVKSITAEYAKIEVDGNLYHVKLKELGRKKTESTPVIQQVSRSSASAPPTPSAPPSQPAGASMAGDILAPLPGLILEVKVKEGDKVKAGQDLLIMEAMKMENQVQAPHDGTVGKMFVKNGDSVAEGDPLVHLDRSSLSTL